MQNAWRERDARQRGSVSGSTMSTRANKASSCNFNKQSSNVTLTSATLCQTKEPRQTHLYIYHLSIHSSMHSSLFYNHLLVQDHRKELHITVRTWFGFLVKYTNRTTRYSTTQHFDVINILHYSTGQERGGERTQTSCEYRWSLTFAW